MNILRTSIHNCKKMRIPHRIQKRIGKFHEWLLGRCVLWFYHLPTKKNKIVFIKDNGKGYACNLKYIAQEIIRQHLPYDMVWLVNDLSEEMPSEIRKVSLNSVRAVFELATAHIFINNAKIPYRVKKKPTQKFIYIPHGQPGAKCDGADRKQQGEFERLSIKHSEQTDVFVSMSSYHTQVIKDNFWVPTNAEIWECGFPRNDMFYHDTIQKQQEIRKKLNIPEGYKIALYAPTFRDNNKTEAYNLDLHRTLAALEQKTGSKWMFFITLHPNFFWYKKPIYDFGEFIWNMSDYTDIHELMLVVDATITDYSSVALDFSNTRRPVFLYASDIDEYKRMRGLKEMYFKYPFSLSKTNDELETAIQNFDNDSYLPKLSEFYKIYGSFDDGHASERFVERLKNMI